MRNYSSIATATTLSSGITSSDTSFSVASASGFPNTPFTLVLDPDTVKEEIVTVTARSGTSMTTVVRGQESTTAVSHDAAAVVKHMVTARDLQEAQDHIAASTGVHGLGSGVAVVGLTTAQTLTNKTISGASNTLSNVPQSAVSGLVSDLAAKAPLASPTFTGTATVASLNASGTVSLPSTTSIGTITSTELGYVDGVTSSIQTQLDAKAPTAGPTFTGTVVLPSTTSIGNVNNDEISYLDGVTSAIQTQLNNKQATISGAASTITSTDLSTSKALVSNSSGKVAASSVTSTELGYVGGVTSAIQTQLDAKAPLASPVFTGSLFFEGSTNDGFETELAVVDPTADRTITFPDATGTVALGILKSGRKAITITSSSTTSTTLGSSDGYSGFATGTNPVVTANIEDSQGRFVCSLTGQPTATGATIIIRNVDGNSITATLYINWIAVG